MVACFAKVSGLPRAELERLAVGEGTDMECEVQAAQLLLYWWEHGSRHPTEEPSSKRCPGVTFARG